MKIINELAATEALIQTLKKCIDENNDITCCGAIAIKICDYAKTKGARPVICESLKTMSTLLMNKKISLVEFNELLELIYTKLMDIEKPLKLSTLAIKMAKGEPWFTVDLTEEG